MTNSHIIALIFFFSSTLLFGQVNSEKYTSDLQKILEKESLLDFTSNHTSSRVLSTTYSKDRTVLHVYMQQTFLDKPIENALATLHYKNEKLIYHTNKFAAFTSHQKTAVHAGVYQMTSTLQKDRLQNTSITLERSIAQDIHIIKVGEERFTIKEYYSLDQKNELIPTYVVTLLVDGEYHSLKYNAATFQLLETSIVERKCNHAHHLPENCINEIPILNDQTTFSAKFTGNNDASYVVLPFPLENPLQGNFAIIEENTNAASPNGWHDGNGTIGQKFNITKGNNVHAFNDRSNTGFPLGDEPQSDTRSFVDHSIDIDSEPEVLIDLNTIQMFYSVNYLHDLLHEVGFDEESGNFQIFNYTGAPGAADEVRAMVQVDGDDKSTLNDASFFTDIDGIKPRLKVSLFSAGNNVEFAIQAPVDLSGSYRASTSTFGGEVPSTELSGKVVLARTGEEFPPYLGCNTLVNSAEIVGNIALIDRGDCQFRDKVARAENAGAIAAIICNFEDAVITMGGGGTLQNPSIPSIMIQSSLCQELRIRLLNNEEITVSIQKPEYTGPAYIDGSMDNGVIAHEFMHGVTDRLVGGRLNSNCLFHAESMAEGWSDFLTLAITYRENEMDPTTPRGIAAYLTQQEADGFGIRRFPYNISQQNTLSYADITGAATVHQVGEIWATVLWEIFWEFIALYGSDESYTDTGSGNYKALYLIVEALKFTACEPGFTDARDGILAADFSLFEGENQCLLWNIFSRRGLGNKASQGSPQDRNDGIADFTLPETCVLPIYLEKNMPDLFSAHTTNQVHLKIINTSNSAFQNIKIIDTLPPGFSIKDLSPMHNFTINNDILSIELDHLEPDQILELRYTLVTGPETVPSQSIKFDPAESMNSEWAVVTPFGDQNWEITPFEPYEGSASWNAYYSFGSSNQFLIWKPEITHNLIHPMLRFYHKYSNPPGVSGGTINIASDDSNIFYDIKSDILKSKYPRIINPRVFSQSNVGGYSGTVTDFQMALVDLQKNFGEDLSILWKFGTFNTTNPFESVGWTIDNIEILDAVYYDLGISLVNAVNNTVISSLPKSSNGGMLLDTELPTALTAHDYIAHQVKIFPNPAKDYFEIEFLDHVSANVTINILDLKGSILQTRNVQIPAIQSKEVWNTSGFNHGLYLIQIISKDGISSHKIIIR